MDLKTQKRMAADVLDCGRKKVWIDPEKQDDVAEAITKVDIRRLVKEGAIKRKGGKGQSRGKAREKKNKKKKAGRKAMGGGKEIPVQGKAKRRNGWQRSELKESY